MKTIKSIALTFAAMVAFTTMSFAKTPAELFTYQTQQLDHRITREINEIAFRNAGTDKGIVLVHFRINEDGSITVTESNYSDEAIYLTIKNKLEGMLLADSYELMGQEFNYVFKFRVIS
jgi:surface antigen